VNKNPHQIATEISQDFFYVKKNYVAEKGFTFSYIRYRLLRPLLKFYYKIFNILHPNRPWTTPASIIILGKLLSKDMVGLEYGSGRSTQFFARKLKHLTSIEHHRDWYKKVRKELNTENIKNVDYQFVERNSKHEIFSNPKSWQEKYNINTSFKLRNEYYDYFQFVNKFETNHFDFILIDGRARVECVLNCIDKLKKNGILVLDNSNRDRYFPALKVLNSWRKVTTTNGLFDTTLWFKP